MWQNIVNWLNTAWNWLNDPLPVVGFSVVTICGCIVYVLSRTSFGKKIMKKLNAGFERVEKQVAEDKKEREEFEKHIKTLLADKDKEIAYLKDVIKKICDALPNKKVKEIGEQIYGKEETDTETKLH